MSGITSFRKTAPVAHKMRFLTKFRISERIASLAIMGLAGFLARLSQKKFMLTQCSSAYG